MARGAAWAVTVWLAALCTAGAVVALRLPVAQALNADPRVGTGVVEDVQEADPPTAALEALEPETTTDADALAERLDAVADPGGTILGTVMDASSGAVLYERGTGTATPASSMKVLSGIVALDVLGPERTFATSTLLASDGTLVLRGGGDPLLTTDAADAYPHPASVARLAEQTAAVLSEQGVSEVALDYDASLFGKPAWNPDWPETFAWSVAPVSALTVDHGRPDTKLANRSEDPARLAADRFAEALADNGILVTDTASGGAGDDSTVLASVESPPVAVLVEQSLLNSDNDVAETLTWQVALERGKPADPSSAASVLADELKRLGLWSDGMAVKDCNGIASSNAVTAASLAGAIQLSLTDDRLRSVATGLPVAGVSGTLVERFEEPEASAGRGVVRAKTGTIRGANTLTGYVVTNDGHTFVFSFLVGGLGQTAARAWLDETAAALASCGC